MNEISMKMKKLAEEYGFSVRTSGNTTALFCKDTDGHVCRWITYDQKKACCTIAGNTDHLNLWFCETRPDLTPERIIRFVKDLNAVFETENAILLRNLIDPEDWQEIAGIRDAYEDDRYRLNKI